MNYQEVRPRIKSGDCLAFSHPISMWHSFYDFKLGMVRMFSKSEYCHVGTAWVVANRVFCLEAVIPKIRIYPLSLMGEFYWIPTDMPWKPSTEEFALSLIGQPYSQWQAALAYFGIKCADNLWYCDEYVRAIYAYDGLYIKEMMPTNLVHALQKLGKPVYCIEN